MKTYVVEVDREYDAWVARVLLGNGVLEFRDMPRLAGLQHRLHKALSEFVDEPPWRFRLHYKYVANGLGSLATRYG